jgi:hypothetical protein
LPMSCPWFAHELPMTGVQFPPHGTGIGAST